ncbi:TadE/TadG family type IV pilus assembly protein [Streptosporangium soli]|nr:pilus assembly protein [Streptosporangium sp. KLBMP 9127]
MSVEAVLLAPVFLLFLMFLAGAGRFVEAQGEVNGAARDAARAASVQRSQGDAEEAATKVATDVLEGQCAGAEVSLDGSVWTTFSDEDPTARGHVQAEVTCELDLEFLGFGAATTMKGTSVVPLERFRRFDGSSAG